MFNLAPPLMYPEVNLEQSSFHPNNIYYSSETYWYHWNSLYQRVLSEFDVECEYTWNKGLLMYCILGNGYIGVFDTDSAADNMEQKFGILPLPATIAGVNAQYLPYKASAVAPELIGGIKDKIIYKDCGLLTISPCYRGGIFDIIDIFARRLALLSCSLEQAIINTRHYYAAYANNERGAATLKAMMDDRNSGKAFTILDKKILTKTYASENPLSDKEEPITWVDFKVGSNYITDKLLMDMASIYNDFDKEVGIPNNPQQRKKERLISNEVESNSAESVARLTVWLNCLEDSVRKTKEVFPNLKLSITRHIYDTGATGAKEAGREVKSDVMENDNNRNV